MSSFSHWNCRGKSIKSIESDQKMSNLNWDLERDSTKKGFGVAEGKREYKEQEMLLPEMF